MTQLSVLIPARNEQWLARTVQDLLDHIEGDTDIIVVLDGTPANPPVPDDPRARVVELDHSVGQRAATNIAAKLSDAKYLMKVDAHCAFDQGFDVKLMADMQDDWTVAPTMRNLHVFNWVCPQGHTRYQGPAGPCTVCGAPTEMDVVWIPKTNPQSKSYCFDTEPHFNYFREFSKRPVGKGELTESMSLQGSCFMLTRERYQALNICDEAWGSWGSQGIEVACKSWLSGGRVIINQKTFYGHLFRTQGAGFGFPYPLSGNQVDHAKKYARELFFENKWPLQVRPLSWLIERFKPVPGWHDDSGKAILTQVLAAGERFLSQSTSPPLVISLTDTTNAESLGHLGRSGSGQEMPSGTMSLDPIDRGNGIGAAQIVNLHNQPEMKGITTSLNLAGVIKDGNPNGVTFRDRADEPSIHQPVNSKSVVMADTSSQTRQSDLPVTVLVQSAGPNPAPSERIGGIDLDSDKHLLDQTGVKSGNREIIDFSHAMPPTQVSDRLEVERGATRSTLTIIPQNAPSRGILYYTDNCLNIRMAKTCRKYIAAAGLPITSVTLKDTDFGRNITVHAERSYKTMFQQIETGLANMTEDFVFFCEHDVLYHPSHFDFIPPRRDCWYYNGNWWVVRLKDGFAVSYDLSPLAGLVVDRRIALTHFRERNAMVKAKGFGYWMGFEPMTHHRVKWENWWDFEVYQAAYPNIDIAHEANLTQKRFTQTRFIRKPKNWQESDAAHIPGWPDLPNIISRFGETAVRRG